MEHIRDFIVLHDHVGEMDVPSTLRHRVEPFGEAARVFRPSDDLFAENSWIQVTMGQGILPQRYHPVADLMGRAELASPAIANAK